MPETDAPAPKNSRRPPTGDERSTVSGFVIFKVIGPAVAAVTLPLSRAVEGRRGPNGLSRTLALIGNTGNTGRRAKKQGTGS